MGHDYCPVPALGVRALRFGRPDAKPAEALCECRRIAGTSGE
jgi:hypothetical protein